MVNSKKATAKSVLFGGAMKEKFIGALLVVPERDGRSKDDYFENAVVVHQFLSLCKGGSFENKLPKVLSVGEYLSVSNSSQDFSDTMEHEG